MFLKGFSVPSFKKPTDTAHTIQLESHLIYALWTYKLAHAGQEAGVEVKTSLVGNGAEIKITCKNEKGKKLDKVEGVVFNNKFSGKVLIPEDVDLDQMVYFEAELPRHGLQDESNSIPVRPVITVTSLQWDRKEVKRNDVAKMTCQFQSGVEDDDEATVSIYEYNPNSCDIKVTSIPTMIKNNKIELHWEFDYFDQTDQIATESEMQEYQKHYVNPQFYFVVAIDGVEIGDKQESGLLKFKEGFEIELNFGEGAPAANEDYVLHLPDGTTKKGALDENGRARETNVSPGPAYVEFPRFPDCTPADKKVKSNEREFEEDRSESAG
jgi:hypothetical protein